MDEFNHDEISRAVVPCLFIRFCEGVSFNVETIGEKCFFVWCVFIFIYYFPEGTLGFFEGKPTAKHPCWDSSIWSQDTIGCQMKHRKAGMRMGPVSRNGFHWKCVPSSVC